MVPRSLELSATIVPVSVPLVHDSPSEHHDDSTLPQSHVMLLKASCCASNDYVSHIENARGAKPASLLTPTLNSWKDASCPTWYPASPSSALASALPPLFAPSPVPHLDASRAKLDARSASLPDGSRAASVVPSGTIVASSSTSSNSSGHHSDHHGFGGEVRHAEHWNTGGDAEIQSGGRASGANLADQAQYGAENHAERQVESADRRGAAEPSAQRAECGMTLSGASDLLNDATGCGQARPSHVLEMLSAAVQQQQEIGGDDGRHTTDGAAASAGHVGHNPVAQGMGLHHPHAPQPGGSLRSGGSHMVPPQKRPWNPPPLPAMGLKLADIKRVIGLKTAPPTKKPRKGESPSPSSVASQHAPGTSSLAQRLAAALPAHAQHLAGKPPLAPSAATLSNVPNAPQASPCADMPSALAPGAPDASLLCRGGESLDDVARLMPSWPGGAMSCGAHAGDMCGGLDCADASHLAHGPMPCAHSPDGSADPVCAGCAAMEGVAQDDMHTVCPGCTPSNALAHGADGPWGTASAHCHAPGTQHMDMMGGAVPPYVSRFPMGMRMSSSMAMGMDALGNTLSMDQRLPMGMSMAMPGAMAMGMGMDALGNPMMYPWQQQAPHMGCSCCPPSSHAGAPWEASLSPTPPPACPSMPFPPAPLLTPSLHSSMRLPASMPGSGSGSSGALEASLAAPCGTGGGLEARLAGALGAEAAGWAGTEGMEDGRDAAGLFCSAAGMAEGGVGGPVEAACEAASDDKEIKRKESNRVSARKSRQRRQLQMDRLEAEAVRLRETNASLSQQAQEAEARVEELMSHQKELQRQCEQVRRQLQAAKDVTQEDFHDTHTSRCFQ
ncbi:hypothetical protein CLOM_g6389 [Closterium sp. NIES-68]|nr:hypothetical protein CLOM_g6389 [Closterium sp. NIES-68]GJP68570.1 hypothetical protein CLOP_g25250 [Closterium sp. NIES-67]